MKRVIFSNDLKKLLIIPRLSRLSRELDCELFIKTKIKLEDILINLRDIYRKSKI